MTSRIHLPSLMKVQKVPKRPSEPKKIQDVSTNASSMSELDSALDNLRHMKYINSQRKVQALSSMQSTPCLPKSNKYSQPRPKRIFQFDHTKSEAKSENTTQYSLKQLAKLGDEELVNYLSSQIVGRNAFINTPYDDKLKLYVDYTASGQELKFLVEKMTKIEEMYANTHTETSYTGAYMNQMLNKAEAEILKQCHANSEDYFMIGAGSGSTAAIEMTQKVGHRKFSSSPVFFKYSYSLLFYKLLQAFQSPKKILGTYLPPQTKELLLEAFSIEEIKSFDQVKDILRKKNKLPLVIVSHYEHHSNEVTWRNQLCDCVVAPPRMDGFIDLEALEKILIANKGRKLIGSFSAGSNVTGIKTDIEGVATLLKKYNGLCFFDFGALAPYVEIDLSKKAENGEVLIDGLYMSPHKFLGGPGTCGILIMSKRSYNTKLSPTHGGGGTVDFVNREGQLYTQDINHREKSGTPGILQIIKCGLVFQIKGALQKFIDKREIEFNKIFFERMAQQKNILIYGPKDEHSKVTIQSFNIWMNGPQGNRFIHHALVIKLLNDLFGIQGRAGCSCAGPYSHYLSNFDDKSSREFQKLVQANPKVGDNIQLIGLKQGWARVNLHFSLQDYEVEYLMNAIDFICEHGYKFLPVYEFNCLTGDWTHVKSSKMNVKFGIDEITQEKRKYAKNEEDRKATFDHQLKLAYQIMENLPKSSGYDSIPEVGRFATFYVEKGNVINRDKIIEKLNFLNKQK